jgi:proteasome assembly chaperone (PAC2) family protein
MRNGVMMAMEYVQISEVPDLENALLIGAFAGWNDAASAASWAVKFLINQWEARPFAELEPELFYDFSETRPKVRVVNGAVRKVSWPANRFYVFRAEREASAPKRRDIVLFLGDEPQLRWKTYTQEVLDVCRQCQVEELALLGSLVAEVPHTAPVQIAGTAGESAMLRRMESEGIERVNYEGDAGILSVLHDAARKEGFAAVSLWGTAPHYISATPNLPVSEALLERLNDLYHFDLRLNDLGRAARRFTQRVSSLVAEDPEVSAYVRELERRTTEDDVPGTAIAGDASGVHRIPLDGELPSPEQAIQDVEEWLRQFRGDAGDL